MKMTPDSPHRVPDSRYELVQGNEGSRVVTFACKASAPRISRQLGLRLDRVLILGRQPGFDTAATGAPFLDDDIHRKNKREDRAENEEGNQVMAHHGEFYTPATAGSKNELGMLKPLTFRSSTKSGLTPVAV